jgi:sec-independent protein translocase protein TatA
VFLANIDGADGIIVLVVVLVLVFGGSAIPKLARNLGSAKNEFEKGLKSSKTGDAAASSTDTTAPPAPPTPPPGDHGSPS